MRPIALVLRWRTTSATLLAASATLAPACSKKEPAQTERKQPWLAAPPDAASSPRVRYVIEERCSAELDLRAKEAAPRGTFRVCKGEIDVDLLDLGRTRATVSVDLGSIEMLGEGDAGRSDELTQQAQNWMDIGASRPEAERERLRWATFDLKSVENLSAPSAHAGKLEKATEPAEPPPVGEEDAAPPLRRERRLVTLDAKGSLMIHSVEVDASVPLRAVFHYAGPAGASAKPERLTLGARRPLVISLRAHDIKPRDASGVFQSQGMKLLGGRVGTEARVIPEVSALLGSR